MRSFLFSLIALGFSQAFADPVAGQLNVFDLPLTFTSDQAKQIHALGGQMLADTSGDTTGAWKRIDNTADSCTNPVFIGRTIHPVWKYALFETVRAVDPDSSTLTWKFEVRRRRMLTASDTTWGPWVKAGQGGGYADVTVTDTVGMPNVLTEEWTARYGLFQVGEGHQLRACPEAGPGTATGATDTVFVRLPRLIGR